MSTELTNPFEYYSYDFSQFKKLNNLTVKKCRFFFDFAQMVNVNTSGVINNDFYSQPQENVLSNTYIDWTDYELRYVDSNNYLSGGEQAYINPNHVAQLFNMDPTIQTTFDWLSYGASLDWNQSYFRLRVPLRNFLPKDIWRVNRMDRQYVAVLGHNFHLSGVNFSLDGTLVQNNPNASHAFHQLHTLLPINFHLEHTGTKTCTAPADGYSITPYSQTTSSIALDTEYLYFTFKRVNQPLYVNEVNPLRVGCISYGDYYDIPVDANMGSQISFNYENSYNLPKNIGGERHVTNNFQAPPPWTHYETDDNRQISLGPWTLSEEFKPFRGRRTWQLEFGGILEADLFPDRFDNIDENGYNYDKEYQDSVYTRLITQLPNTRFMFMPDITDPHNIAICKLDGDVEINKQTHGIYDIALNVREVW